MLNAYTPEWFMKDNFVPTPHGRKREKAGELEFKLLLLLCGLMIILAVIGFYLQYVPAPIPDVPGHLPSVNVR